MASGTAARIAAEAGAILRAEGATAVSMRRVASAVGLTPMAIYRHFPNRQALLRAIAARGWDRVAEPAPEGDPRATLCATVDALVDFAIAQPQLYALLTAQAHATDHAARDFRCDDSPLLGPVAGAVDEAMHRDRLTPTTSTRSRSAWSR